MSTIKITCSGCDAQGKAQLVRHVTPTASWPVVGDLPVGWVKRTGESKSLHLEVTLYFCSDLCLRRYGLGHRLEACE